MAGTELDAAVFLYFFAASPFDGDEPATETAPAGSTLTAEDAGSTVGYATNTIVYGGIDTDHGTLAPAIPPIWQLETTNDASGILFVSLAGDYTGQQADLTLTVDGVPFAGADAALFQVQGSGPTLTSQWAWLGATEFVDAQTYNIVAVLP